MTAATPLVEKVAKAISQWMNGARLPSPPNWERLQEATRQAYREQAEAALNACEAEKLRDVLREYIAAADESMTGNDDVAAMLRFSAADNQARALLAKLDGKPTRQPV